MDEATARAVMERLGAFLDQFESCLSRRVQRRNASRYVEGLLNDSERKSMQAMHGRLADPGSYQGLQHFITHALWASPPFWKRLRQVVPVRAGLLLLDETSFPKQGRHSVGVARQYCGALGKVANCQVAVSSALRADGLTWPLALELYLPKEWADDEARRAGAGIPPSLGHREKWRIGLTQIRHIRAAGFTLNGVVADAEYGRVTAFRTALERSGLIYGLGCRTTQTVWPVKARRYWTITALMDRQPADGWAYVSWGTGTKRPLAAHFFAQRVRPKHARRECWLLCERRESGERKAYLSNLPASASLEEVVALTHGRWPIEQQYREFKDDLGLDHFEGRSYTGWNHHAVLAALTFTFIQLERRRHTEPLPTFPAVRNLVREIVTIQYLFTRPDLLEMLTSFKGKHPLRN